MQNRDLTRSDRSEQLCDISVHPIYVNYGYLAEKNEIIHIPNNKPVKQNVTNSGYSVCTVSELNNQSCVLCHRFIWECCNDKIPKGYEIDHIDKNKINNKIDNLRCISISENRKLRDHTNIIKFAKIAHTLKRFIKATNIETNEYNCFKSKNQCGKFYGISPAMVYLICVGLNNYRSVNTEKGKYKFEYVDEKDVNNLIEIPHGRKGKRYNKA